MAGNRRLRWPLLASLGFTALVAGAVWALTLRASSLPLQRRVPLEGGEVLVNLWREGRLPGEVLLTAQVTDPNGVPLPPDSLEFRVGPAVLPGRRVGWEVGGRYAYAVRVRLDGAGPWTVAVRFSYRDGAGGEARFTLTP